MSASGFRSLGIPARSLSARRFRSAAGFRPFVRFLSIDADMPPLLGWQPRKPKCCQNIKFDVSYPIIHDTHAKELSGEASDIPLDRSHPVDILGLSRQRQRWVRVEKNGPGSPSPSLQPIFQERQSCCCRVSPSHLNQQCQPEPLVSS